MADSETDQGSRAEILRDWQAEACAILQQPSPPPEISLAVRARALETATMYTPAMNAEEFADAARRGTADRFPIAEMRPQVASGFIHCLDEMVFGAERVPAPVHFEVVNLKMHPSFCTDVAVILYESFGDEILDFAFELAAYGLRADSDANVDRLINLSSTDKKKIMKNSGGKRQSSHEKKILALYWMFGSGLLTKHTQGYTAETLLETPEAILVILDKIKQRFFEDKSLRDDFLGALPRLRLTADIAWIQAFVRQGMRLLQHAREVTDSEWQLKLRRQADEMESDEQPIEGGGENAAAYKAIFLAARRAEIDKYLKDHPNPASPRELVEVIECDRLKNELEQARKDHDNIGLQHKLREIVSRVLASVSRYRGLHISEDYNFPPWQRGLPRFVFENKVSSCFSAPWLTAALLMKCGIRYEDMLYCHVYQGAQGMVGGHGSLFLFEQSDDCAVIDPNGIPSVYDVPNIIRKLSSWKCVSNLRRAERKKPVNFDLPEQLASSFGLPRKFAVMQLSDGLTSGHLLHVGLEFLTDGKLEEAAHAFTLGTHVFEDPEVFFYLGVISMKRKDLGGAQKHFERALALFPLHMLSRYALGEVKLLLGRPTEAHVEFAQVANPDVKIYAGKSLVDRMCKTASLSVEQLAQLRPDEFCLTERYYGGRV